MHGDSHGSSGRSVASGGRGADEIDLVRPEILSLEHGLIGRQAAVDEPPPLDADRREQTWNGRTGGQGIADVTCAQHDGFAAERVGGHRGEGHRRLFESGDGYPLGEQPAQLCSRNEMVPQTEKTHEGQQRVELHGFFSPQGHPSRLQRARTPRPGRVAKKAAFIAPTEVPTRRSGSIPAS